ncbi:MAG: ATP-binding protein, partial [Planctomycetota bacterium]
MASLFVIQGRDQGKRYELSSETTSLGRDATNSIQVHDTEVSRHHCEIRRSAAGYQLVDLGSLNGAFINNQKFAERRLVSGDRVQLGRTLYLFTDMDEPVRSAVADVNIVPSQSVVDGSRIVQVLHESAGRMDEAHHLASSPTGIISQDAIVAQDAVIAQDASVAPEAGGEERPSPWLERIRGNLQVMYRTALAVSHTMDIDELLQRILELIFEWVKADRGCVMLRDSETGELLPKARRDRQAPSTGESMRISRTILDYVLLHKEGVITSDARQDQRFDSAGSIVTQGVREAICVPLQGRYGIVGVIYIDTYTPPGTYLDRHRHQFTGDHLKLMVAIGHQAALAVEDTSYYSALVHAERLAAMGQTIATLSHHVKNILQGIRGGSYLIDEGLQATDTELIRKGWRIVEKNQEKISNLVMDMLTFSKEREPEMVPAQINEVIADVCELMQARAADARVQLECRPDPLMPPWTLDPDALHRAILNVVTNAIDACERRPDARVIVSSELDRQREQVRVIVEDNGEGIAAADLQKIFSVFESSKGNRGTGLGLPVSQKILREHGGDITVTSQPGHGSRFLLAFPAIPVSHSATMNTVRGE